MFGFDCTLIGKLESDIAPVIKNNKLIAADFSITVPRREPFCEEEQFEKVRVTYSGEKMEYIINHYGRGSLLRVQGEFFIAGRYSKKLGMKVFTVTFKAYPEGSSVQAIIVKQPKIMKHKDESDDYVGFMDRGNAIFEED